MTTTQEVAIWFEHLLVNEQVLFHPDDLFRDFVNVETGDPTFTAEKADELDLLMVKAHEICDAQGVDIYGLAMEVFEKVNPDFFKPDEDEKDTRTIPVWW